MAPGMPETLKNYQNSSDSIYFHYFGDYMTHYAIQPWLDPLVTPRCLDIVVKASLVSLSVQWGHMEKVCHEYGAKMLKNLTQIILSRYFHSTR